MKAIQTKTTTPAHNQQQSSQPFFKKAGSESSMPKNEPFFSPKIQTKLSIGEPNDKYEQEADSMADKVVQRLATPDISKKTEPIVQAKTISNFIPISTTYSQNIVQNKCAECEKEEKLQKKENNEAQPELQLKPIFESGASDDDTPVQRKCATCGHEEEKLQKKGEKSATETASPSIEGSLSASKGSGSPLPENTRNAMESSFGSDFSGVRIHTGSNAVQMSKDLNAQAFTHGNDIYFNAGKYDTNSQSGQHLLAHELTHTVQQGGGVQKYSTPDIQKVGNQEFIPIIKKTPDITLSSIGDEIEQGFEVTNASVAPSQTSFHWGGNVIDNKLKFISMKNQRHGQKSSIKAQSMAAGNTVLNGNLQYQVPGGPEIINTYSADVSIESPTIVNINYFKTTPTGNIVTDADTLIVGETLYIDIKLGNAAINPNFSPLRIQQLTSNGVLELDGARVHNSAIDSFNTIRLIYNPHNPGVCNNQVSILLGNTAVTNALVFALRATSVLMDKQTFLNYCSECNTMIDLARAKGYAWLTSISTAYRDAWKNHTDTLKDQADSERLINEMILGAALAFIPGGVGGVVGTAMKNAGQSDFMIDGIKDLAKWGAGRNAVVQTTSRNISGSSGLTAFPTDPAAWRDNVEGRLNTELAVTTQTLLNWQHKANNQDPNFLLNFDPREAMRSSLSIQGMKVEELIPVDTGLYALNFEKGFWTEWLRQFGYKTILVTSRAYAGWSIEHNAGKKVRKRCESIGLDIAPYIEESRLRAEQKAHQLNAEKNKGH